MASDFGVKFLGRVPLDVMWGRLVEEGRRPIYGEGVEEEDVEGDAEPREKEEGLLVDKYRSCSLCAIFGGFTIDLVGIVEGTETST